LPINTLKFLRAIINARCGFEILTRDREAFVIERDQQSRRLSCTRSTVCKQAGLNYDTHYERTTTTTTKGYRIATTRAKCNKERAAGRNRVASCCEFIVPRFISSTDNSQAYFLDRTRLAISSLIRFHDRRNALMLDVFEIRYRWNIKLST